MDFTRQQCLEITDLYHQRPILWNPRHPSYFNKVKKDDAWREIAEICGRDVKNIQKKVESLKGSYRRERAKVKKSTGTGKGKDETYTSQWFAFDYLRFLDDKDEPRRSINNLQPNSPEDGINTSSEIEDFTDEPRNNTEIEASQNDEPALETSEGAAPSEIKTKTFKSPKKRAVKRRKEEEDPRIMQAFGYLQNVASGSASNKRDDCSVYGEHVANKIRKFDDRLKSLAQHRINNILFDLEMSHYNSSAAPQPLREFAPGYPQTMSTNQYDYQQVSTRFPQSSFNNEAFPRITARICKPETCKKGGCTSITIDDKEMLFNSFYGMDYNDQSSYLVKCIAMGAPKRRRAGKTDATSKKLAAFTYSVMLKRSGKYVSMLMCKRNFCDIFQINTKRIQILLSKMKDGVTIPTDLRGVLFSNSNNISGIKMSSKRNHSALWGHFKDEGDKRAKCNYCSQSISIANGSNGNLNRHMKSKHPLLLLTEPEPQRQQAYCASNVTNTCEDSKTSERATVLKPSRAQTEITHFVQRPPSSRKIEETDKQVIKMIDKGHHALRMVEEPQFRELIIMVSHCPNYELPSRKKLSESLLSKIYNEYTEKIKIKLKKAQAVCVTTDAWTSRNNELYCCNGPLY
ncbi:unnamed protein product [Acanthoscelides obtectus]|uniref:MADF domain-containing protein n=1 Tax=Acanthoscelides obtectus TaxID=200917 RepID=A0A9P0JKC2_ACAOB|nr:unnamed protein product [Acanthoscelides obtectus]CAK1655042.1 Zinc finger BED domain-containing protein 1 [Acanthoscelides obtectus]